MKFPNMQIVGFMKESLRTPPNTSSKCFQPHLSETVEASEAEMIKYFVNTFLANKGHFGLMYDLCHELGINYKTVKDISV